MSLENNPRAELEERLRFETLIADLSSRFVNLPAGEVDREIMDAERCLCEVLGLDFSVVWQWSAESPGFFTLTHYYSAQAGPQPPERMSQDQYPWAREELQAGRIIKISSPEDLPPEAARDRETLLQFGIKSNLALPLAVGGEPPVGILGLGTTQTERAWPDAVVQRLQLVAQVFANALARKRADAALRASEVRLAAGTELAGLGYYEVDYGERNCFFDDRFREICGVPPEVQQGLDPVQFWLEHIYPDDRQFLSDERQKLHDGKVDLITAEYRYLHPAKGQRWLHHSARVAERSAGGAGLRTFGVIRDITRQKQAELEARELRNNLTHLTRVNTVGALSGSLAHELNQPLGIILSNAQAAQELLTQQPPDVAEVQAILTDIVAADRLASAVIERLRAMLKHGQVSLQPLALNQVIEEVVQLTQADLIGRGVTVVRELAPNLSPISGDHVQLQQLFLNLILNAADAMAANAPGARRLHLQTQFHHDRVRASVRDEGIGLSADAERLFQPFYTTKTQGLGLGLSICRSIAAAHHGQLWAEPHPTRGAMFHLELPAAGEVNKP